MPILLKDLLQADQKKAVEAAASLVKNRRTAELAARWEFYVGNHWQNGKGWIGAKPLLGRGFNQTMNHIREGFVSENVIKEVVDRHVGGILGREPLWGFVPQKLPSSGATARRKRFAKLFNVVFTAIDTVSQFLGKSVDPQAQEADDALTLWWDKGEETQKPKRKLKDALARCLNEEKVLLRFFVPRGLYGADKTVPTQNSLADALNVLHLDVIPSDQGGVFIDTDTQKPFGVYVYQVEKSRCAELTYVNDSGQTVHQILSDNPDRVVEPIAYDLQGRLWMYEVNRTALITEQICTEQRSLNLTKTMMMRNVNLAGNLERAIINAERPKQKVRVPDDNNPLGYREVVMDSEWLVGPGVTNSLTGLLMRDDDGKIIGRANPNISYRDPVPIDTFVGTRQQCRESILGQAQQLHIMISGDATVSGRSKEQSRAEYRASLQDSKDPIDGAGRWILEGALRIAAEFCDRVADFADLRCVFDARIEDGPVSPEERSANREDMKAGILSQETTMSRNGVEDTDAEKARIAEDKAQTPTSTVLPPPTDTNSGKELIQ